MNKSISRLERLIACCLVMVLAAPFGVAATTTPLPSAPVPQSVAEDQTQAAPANPTAAPGTSQSGQSRTPQTAPTDQQNNTPAPVGTAAAPYFKPEGVPASRPAGAAIAPARQKRTRSFAIRVALLVGAGIAIGTVAAASLGSPARPH